MKWLLFGALMIWVISQVKGQDRDWFYDLEGLWDLYGFEYEEYSITADDGYITLLQRIRAPIGDDNPHREPMYAHRPFGTPTEEFFLLGPEDSPGFRLVSAGYDVWFINPRGSILSRRHVSLNPYSVEFWNFDLVSMANDHVAAVDFILEQTGFDQLHIFGRGTGGMAIAYAIALFPDFFNPRVRDIQYVATTFSFAHSTTWPFQVGAALPGILTTLANLGVNTIIMDSNPAQSFLIGSLWNPFPAFWMLMQQLTVGLINPLVDDSDAYANFLFRGTNGFGTHLVQHFIQSARTQMVTYFDYGPDQNLEIYGSEIPPEIHYENHQMPIGMYYSPDDELADLEDAQWAADILQDVVVYYNTYPDYTHLSFNIGKDMYFLDDLLEVVQQYPITFPDGVDE